jgi:hypothetical protein
MSEQHNQTEDPEYLSPEEVCIRYRGMSKQTLAVWRCKKQGPPFRKIGGKVLYPVFLLRQWEKTQDLHTQESAKQKPKKRR